MRIRRAAAFALIAAAASACGGGGILRQYEYEEEIYLSLDGTATVYVNGSVPALDALRGGTLTPAPNARIDRNEVRAMFETPVTHVARVTDSRRSNRRFVHVRLDVADIRNLGQAAPFAWSTYDFHRDGDLFIYKQAVGASANKPVGNVGWTGREIVAFRVHVPSKIPYHNAGAGNPKRGNILVWEQPLTERLRGTPVAIEARMETQSILYRTLWLFGATFVAVAITFGIVIWLVMRRGVRPVEASRSAGM